MHVPKTWNQKLSISVHSGGAGWNGEPGADSHDPLSLGNHSDAILQPACCHVDHSGIRNGNGLALPVARNAVNRWVAMHTVVHAWCVASDNFVSPSERARLVLAVDVLETPGYVGEEV